MLKLPNIKAIHHNKCKCKNKNIFITDACTLQDWHHQPYIQKIGKGLLYKFVLLWTKSAWLKDQAVSKQSSIKALWFSTVIRQRNWTWKWILNKKCYKSLIKNLGIMFFNKFLIDVSSMQDSVPYMQTDTMSNKKIHYHCLEGLQ